MAGSVSSISSIQVLVKQDKKISKFKCDRQIENGYFYCVAKY
jgi:hypothetical protein